MRSYIFNFSTKKIEKLGIKGIPIIILDYLDKFFKSGKAKVKVQNDKNYFWITYNKIVKDNLFLGIKHQRVKQIIDGLCAKKVLEKFNYEKHYTNLYIHINYEKLIDLADSELNQIVGLDTSLQFYMPKTDNYFNNIKYNAFKFIYETPAIQEVLIENNKIRFRKILLGYLQKLLNTEIFSLIKQNFKINVSKNTIQLDFKLSEQIVETNVYKLEQCIVGSYTTFLISELINKKNFESTLMNSRNEVIKETII